MASRSSSKSASQSSKKSDESSQSGSQSCDAAELKKLVQDCVYYLLTMHKTKYAIKRPDIIKYVLKEHKAQFQTVILKAKEELKKVFGMQLFEIKEKKGNYFLVSLDKNQKISKLTENECRHHGLVLFILTVIWMKDGTVAEEDMWEALKILNIDVESASPHPVFDDVKKYITGELVKQLYIVYERISNESPIYEFKWGPRADYEIDKAAMLNDVARIYDVEPENFISQYQESQEELDQRKVN